MPLLKDGRIVGEDAFQPMADDAALPASGAVLVTYTRWQAEKEQLTGRNAPLGIQVTKEAALKYIEGGEAAAIAHIPAIRDRVLNSADAREGIMSFVERRAAVFQGK